MNSLLKVVISIALFLLLFVSLLHPASSDLSSDLSEHLLIGKVVLTTHSFITTNMFSYTNPHFPYVDYEWITEIIFFLIMQSIGISGLIILKVGVVMLAFFTIYYYAIKRFNILLVSYISLFFFQILFERTYLRPEIFSYVFLAVFITLLYKFREKYFKAIYLLIPLQLLWVNMHIYFLVGIYIIGLFLIEGMLLFRQKDNGKYVRTLLILFVSSIIVSCINPYGLNGLFYPFKLLQSYRFPVEENFSIFAADNSHPGYIVLSLLMFKLLAIGLILSLFIIRKKSRVIDWLISFSFIIVSAIAVRNLPLFVFITFIPFCFTISMIRGPLYSLVKKNKMVISLLVIFFIGIFMNAQFEVNLDGFGVDAKSNSEKVADFLVANNIQGPILNNYNIGDYLVYRLYPKESVFVDARPEAYPSSFFEETYFPTFQDDNGFIKADNLYHFNAIVLSYVDADLVFKYPRGMTFFNEINSNPNWKLVYLDDYAVVFLRKTNNNNKIIEAYGISENNYKVPQEYPLRSLGAIEYFFRGVGWKNALIQVDERILSLSPRSCGALRNLLVLLDPNDPQVNTYSINYQMYCQRN